MQRIFQNGVQLFAAQSINFAPQIAAAKWLW
jgi:hypothetical protein